MSLREANESSEEVESNESEREGSVKAIHQEKKRSTKNKQSENAMRDEAEATQGAR